MGLANLTGFTHQAHRIWPADLAGLLPPSGSDLPHGRRGGRSERRTADARPWDGLAGVQRVMLQWLDLDDMKGLEALEKAAH